MEKQTKPRPLHTESSLLSAMESCGKELQETELRDSLKDIGIGTPATRASIIETLFSRDYVRRDKKNLVPTEKGLAVYHTVKGKRIADVEMTGQWETALARIEMGGMDAATFRKGIEVYTAQITEELLQVRVSVADGERIPSPNASPGASSSIRKSPSAATSIVALPSSATRAEGTYRQTDYRPCNQRQNVPYQRLSEQGWQNLRCTRYLRQGLPHRVRVPARTDKAKERAADDERLVIRGRSRPYLWNGRAAHHPLDERQPHRFCPFRYRSDD